MAVQTASFPTTDDTAHGPNVRMSQTEEYDRQMSPCPLVASSRPGSLCRLGPWAARQSCGQAGQGGTHVDEVVPVADEQIAQDAGFIEVSQADHVLHAMDRRGVHGLDVRGILRGDPVFLQGGTVANVRMLSWSREMHTAGEGAQERREPPVCEAPVRVLSCSVAKCHQL